jgi:hypothetical protein
MHMTTSIFSESSCVRNLGFFFQYGAKCLCNYQILFSSDSKHRKERLLLSLNTVDYMSDKVTVEIWIDRSKEGRIHEQTYAVGHKFVFEKGSKTVTKHRKDLILYNGERFQSFSMLSCSVPNGLW